MLAFFIRLRLLLFILYIISVGVINTVLSQEETKAQKAIDLSYENPTEAFLLAKEALDEAKNSKDQIAEAHALNSLGWVNYMQGKYSDSKKNLLFSKALFKQLGREKDVITVGLNLAEVYTHEGQTNEALKFVFEAEKMASTLPETRSKTDIYRQLAIHYRRLDEYEKAEKTFRLVISDYLKMEDFDDYTTSSVSYSILLKDQKKFKESLAVLNECFAFADKKKLPLYTKANIQENLGETYVALGDYESALLHFNRAKDLFFQLGNPADVAYENMCLGQTYWKLKRNKEAIASLTSAYQISDSMKIYSNLVEASHLLSSVYREQKNWPEAFRYLELSKQWEDTVNQTLITQQSKELIEKYQSEKKQQEIEILKTKNNLAEAKSARNRLFIIALLLFAFLLIFGAWFIIHRIQIGKKLEQQKMQNTIASDLHDDIGSGLASISIHSKIGQGNLDKEQMANKFELIKTQSTELMQRMHEIIWLINPSMGGFDEMIRKIQIFGKEICRSQGIVFKEDIEYPTESGGNAQMMKELYLLSKEAIINSAKHSQCKEIQFSFLAKKNGYLSLRISDNGIGVQEDKASGMGMTTLRKRAEKLNLFYEMNSTPETGTEIIVKSK